MVDEGLGKERMSVVLEDDDNLQVIRVNRDDARAVQKYQVSLNGRFGESVNSELLQKAIIAVYKGTSGQLAKRQSEETTDLAELVAEEEGKLVPPPPASAEAQLFSTDFLLQMLLKISAQLALSVDDMQDKTVQEFFSILIQISEKTKEKGIAEGKNTVELEKEIVRHWENLVDKAQAKDNKNYAPKEYPAVADEEEEDEDVLQAEAAMTQLIRNASSVAKEATFVDGEYVQNKNSYLLGLPPPD